MPEFITLKSNSVGSVFSDGSNISRFDVRGNNLFYDKELTFLGFGGVEDADWENTEEWIGSTGVWRVGKRGSSFMIDRTLTATGFSGDEDIDWDNVDEYNLP